MIPFIKVLMEATSPAVRRSMIKEVKSAHGILELGEYSL
jgi:hypothetical protein